MFTFHEVATKIVMQTLIIGRIQIEFVLTFSRGFHAGFHAPTINMFNFLTA